MDTRRIGRWWLDEMTLENRAHLAYQALRDLKLRDDLLADLAQLPATDLILMAREIDEGGPALVARLNAVPR